MPPSYGSMALVFLAIAVTGALAPALRGHRRLEMSAAVAAGVAVIAWSARHALSAAQVGQGCRSSSGAALHCYPIMSASPWSQGDYAGVALSFTLGIVVAALMVTAAYLHAYRGRRDMLVVLWIAAGSLLFIGLPSGEVLPALPGLFAVVSGLAGVGLFSSDDQLAEASATT